MSATVESAVQAFKEQNFPQAVALFEELTETQPENTKALFFLGQSYMALGRRDDAMAVFKRVHASGDPRLGEMARQAAMKINMVASPTGPLNPALAPQASAPVVAPTPEPEPDEEAHEPPTLEASVPEPSPEAYSEPEAHSAPEAAADTASSARVATARSQAAPAAGKAQSFFCAQCGIPIPEDRWEAPWCACGWGKASASTNAGSILYLSQMFEYLRKRKGSIEINVNNDHFVITHEVKIKHMSNHLSKVDPRLVFRTVRGLPCINRKELGFVKDEKKKEAQFTMGYSGGFTWDEAMVEFQRVLGTAAFQPNASLKAALVDYGGIPAAEIVALEGREDGRTLGQALLDTGRYTLQDILVGAMGAGRVFRPEHHYANEIGHTLVGLGELTPDGLRKALATQMRERKSLIDVLKRQAVSPSAIQTATGHLNKLNWGTPEVDSIGEQLFVQGKLNRTDLAHALRESKENGRELSAALLGKGKVDHEVMAAARKRQQLKLQMRMEGAVRLGDVLVKQQVCTAETIYEALSLQVEDHRPLGELLVAMEACVPEQLVFALEEQESALEVMVDKVMSGVAEKEAAKATAAAEKAKRDAKSAKKKARLAKIAAMNGEEPPEDDDDDDMPPLPMPKRKGKKLQVTMPMRLMIGATCAVLLLSGVVALYNNRPTGDAEQTAAGDKPVVAEPPLLKTLPAAGAGKEPVKLANIYSHPTVEVDVDDMMGRMESGEPNPLGNLKAGRLGAPSTVEAAGASLSLPANRQPKLQGMASDMAVLDQMDANGAGAGDAEGVMQLALGNPEGASKAFQTDLAGKPGDAALLSGLAKAHRLMGQNTKGAAFAQRASQVAPSNAAVQNEFGTSRLAVGDSSGAIAAFQAAAKSEPGNPIYQNNLGLAHEKKGNAPAAAKAYQAALKLAPDNPDSLYHLGVLAQKQDPSAARMQLIKAASGYTVMVESHMARRQAMQGQGDVSGVIGSLQRGMAANTMLGESYMAIGRLAVKRGDGDEAKGYFGRARDVYRTNALARIQLGDAYLAGNQPGLAIQEWVTASRVAPVDPVPHYKLGMLAKQQGKTKQAQSFLRRAIALDKGVGAVPDAADQLKAM